MSDQLDDLLVIEVEQRAPLEYRSASTLDVRFPERIVSIIVTPYDTPTPILRNGEWIVESFDPHAYDGIERRANRVKVNRDHDVQRTCGRAIALHPNRPEGLVADLRISKTTLGDETLELASDGALDASAGFAPMPGGEQWDALRQNRRVQRAWLGHIAMVSDPAYEGANVLDVRHVAEPGEVVEHLSTSTTATPRLDTVLAELASIGYVPRTK